MITKHVTINPMKLFDVSAIQIARAAYKKWKSAVPFEIDLRDYLEHGIVISRQDIFVMAKIVETRNGPAWFCRMAVGDLKRLLGVLPCKLDRIQFCRRNDGRIREYSLDRLLELVNKAKGEQ